MPAASYTVKVTACELSRMSENIPFCPTDMTDTADLYPYRIDHAAVYMHTTPELSGEMCDELPYGTRLRILSKVPQTDSLSWVRCETSYGYCGYLPEKALSPQEADTVGEKLYSFAVTASFCDVLLDSVYKYRPILTLPRASVVLARRPTLSKDRFFPIYHKSRRFFVPTAALRPLDTQKRRNERVPSSDRAFPTAMRGASDKRPTCTADSSEKPVSERRKQICDDALSYLGSPYRWGGRTPSGIDCSGLCFTVYALNGLPLWRDAFADKRFVHEIDESDLLPGDLIYFKGHMALYIGDREYVHACASAGAVTVGSLNPDSVLWREDLAKSLLCFAKSHFL